MIPEAKNTESNTLSDLTIASYNKKAASYEAKWKEYLVHTHETFLNRIAIDEDDTVLDASGGTGLLAQMLIDRNFAFRHLTINDPSDKMLAISRQRLSDKTNISFSNERADKLSHKTHAFDRILCLNSFHFYADQPEALKRFYRILAPGGRLYILDWNRAGFFIPVNKIITWTSSEYIDTRSLSEISEMLSKNDFETFSQQEWRWRYWNFYFIEALKLP